MENLVLLRLIPTKMEQKKKDISLLLLHFSLHLPLFLSGAQPNFRERRASNGSVSAILVFGDSTVDPGNNNYVETVSKANFPPYGRDFFNMQPTGRFSNGRLTTDFIASYVGLKPCVPPYLDHSLTIDELLTGVSFASASSGFDPLTSQISNTIPVTKQLDYFKEYKEKLRSAMGEERTEEHIRNALFIVSAGTNDFLINYFSLPSRRRSFSASTYNHFLVHLLKHFLQGLWEEGARKIGVVGLPPIGCLPIVITLNSDNAIHQRHCIQNISSVVGEFNLILQYELSYFRSNFDLKVQLIDIYGPLLDMIRRSKEYGFNDVDRGCCGTGYFESSYSCNPRSDVCPDSTTHVFWDSVHPTQKTYYNLFKAAIPTIDLIIKD